MTDGFFFEAYLAGIVIVLAGLLAVDPRLLPDFALAFRFAAADVFDLDWPEGFFSL